MLDNMDFNFDLDGDGVLDSFATEADLDGDGIADSLLIDSNGDGTEDSILQELDLNNDGIVDGYQLGFDSDGNGMIDTITTLFDSDIDGVIDAMETLYDPDENGISDFAVIDQLADTDGDLQFDTLIHGVDSDVDGDIDSYEVYDYDDVYNNNPDFDTFDVEEDGGRGMFIDELDNFDPNQTDSDDVIGDPEEGMAEWEFQGDTNRCALYSQKFIIDEMTGQDVDIEEIADLAEENGWFSEEGGTNLLDMNKVLDHYGIENEMSFGNDLDDLENCLSNGGKAVVSIDADEIWYGENDDIFTPGDGPNHAVEVIGIDNSDPDNPMVILNDSGNPNGCGEMIPADVFMDAWEDGDCQMIDVPEV